MFAMNNSSSLYLIPWARQHVLIGLWAWMEVHLVVGMFSACTGTHRSLLVWQVTKAFNSTVGCASYLAMKEANHYGMNDYVAPSSSHQVPGKPSTSTCCTADLHAVQRNHRCHAVLHGVDSGLTTRFAFCVLWQRYQI